MGTAIGILLSMAVMRFVIAKAAVVAPPSMEVWLIAPLLPVIAVLMMSLWPAGRASLIEPSVIMREL